MTTLRNRLAMIVAVVLACGARSAHAQAVEPGSIEIAVIGVEPVTRDAATRAAASRLTTALRAYSYPLYRAWAYRIVTVNERAIARVRASCPTRLPACIAKHGPALHARIIVLGTIEPISGGYHHVTLRRVDVATKRVEGIATTIVDGKREDMMSGARTLYRKLELDRSAIDLLVE